MRYRVAGAAILLMPFVVFVACEDSGTSSAADAGPSSLGLDVAVAPADPSGVPPTAPLDARADADAAFYPATCAERGSSGPMMDAEYTLYVDHNPAKPWTSYCYG